MIKSANEMRDVVAKNEIYQKGYQKAIESVMQSIERASKIGLRKTCFCPSSYWYDNEYGIRTYISFYDEVKAEFKKYGYTFKPTGYIGGVWQQSEDICW